MIGEMCLKVRRGMDPCASMCNGGGGGSGSSKTTQEIPDELKPLAQRYASDAMRLSSKPYQAYSGERYADLNADQQGAIDMIRQRAQNGSATVDNAEASLGQMISGAPNPYLDKAVNSSLGQVQSRVNSQFGGNNYGSTAHQETLARTLGEQANSMYAGAYDADQGRRLSAIGMAPQFGNQQYADAQQLLNAGQINQDQAQQDLDFNYQQFQEKQNLPYKNLAAMSGVFGSNLGSSSTTTQSGGGK